MYDFALFENPVTPDPNDRIALISNQKTFSLEDLLLRATNRGSTVTIAEFHSAFEEITYATEQLLAEGGGSIKTPLFNLTVRIVGVFNGDEDNFDPSRHQVKIRLTPGIRLREMEKKIKLRKVAADKPRPILQHVYDHTSESQDEIITSGGGMRITGSLLKFDEADVNQGVFFIHSNGTETRVAGRLLRNKPGELIFIAPQSLASGNYTIEVRSIIKGNKEIRKGTFTDDLTVA